MKRTFGQIAVGLDFNPSGDDAVGIIKQKYADIIDLLHDLRLTSTSGEQKRWASTAITQTELAQMAAVKGLTWKDYVPPAMDFNAEVVELSKATPVLVDFYMDTCQPCHVIAPKLAELALQKNFAFVKIDVKAERLLAEQFKVSSVPRLIVFSEGEVYFDSLSEQWPGIMPMVQRIDTVINEIRGLDAKGVAFEKDSKN